MSLTKSSGHTHQELVKRIYEKNPEIILPPEYALFLKDNLLRMLIRLARYKFVSKMIKQTDCLLEAGCGSGVGAIFLGQNCRRVIGVDSSELEIGEAKKINRRDNVSFMCEDIYNFPVQERFDVVVSLDVIEHMDAAAGEKFLAHLRRYLKPDGMLVLGTPSIYSYEYQGELSKAAHIKLYDQEELQDVVEKFFLRTLCFSMNDEMVHTGFPKMAWYYFVLAFYPKEGLQ